MAHPWEAENIMSPEKALLLISEQFPDLNAKTISLFGSGWDNTAYLVNKNLIFRFPRRQVAVAFMKDMDAQGLLPHKEILYSIIDGSKNLPVPQEKVICHGDLYARHFLLDEHHHLTGVIDWGDIHLNSPAADLAVMYTFLPPHTHHQFKEIYGPISQETLELARFRAIIQCLNFIMAGHNNGDKDIKREALRGLDYIVNSLLHS